MNDNDASEAPAEIGGRVRKLRLDRRMTLETLASAAGLSMAHLSRFERGKRALSVGSLIRLAKALDTPVGQLVGQPAAGWPGGIVQADARWQSVSESEGGYRYVCLSSSEAHSAFLIEMGPGGGRTRRSHHPGSERICVLKGRLQVEFPAQQVDLAPGDTIAFPADLPHRLSARAEQAQFLIFVSPSGDSDVTGPRAARQDDPLSS